MMLLLCKCAVAQHVVGLSLAGDRGVVLRDAEAASVLKQCSRLAPVSNDGYWTPDSNQTGILEENLLKHLSARKEAGLRVPPDNQYARQYIGFKKDGRDYIYGNFYPLREAFYSESPHRAFVVCDGGPSFWGVVFDVERQVFDEPQFNGPSW